MKSGSKAVSSPNPDSGSQRAVSDLVGFALTVGIILVGVGIVATVGVDQIEEYQGTQNVENAERAMTVLGGNLEQLQESRATALSSEIAVHNGRLAVGASDESSNLTVDVEGTGISLVEEPMRTISYRTEDTSVVYEGGAVILDNPSGESIPVREPSFICSGDRAVVSFVTIHPDSAGQGYSGATASVSTRLNESRIHFPASRSGSNSQGDATGVTVTINTSYDAAWRSFFSGNWQDEATASNRVRFECDAEQVFARQSVVSVRTDR